MKQSRRFRFVLGLVTDFSIFSRFQDIDSDDGKVQCTEVVSVLCIENATREK